MSAELRASDLIERFIGALLYDAHPRQRVEDYGNQAVGVARALEVERDAAIRRAEDLSTAIDRYFERLDIVHATDDPDEQAAYGRGVDLAEGELRALRATEGQEMSTMTLEDTLLAFSEWLDGEEHMMKKPRLSDDRTHEDFAREFIAWWTADPRRAALRSQESQKPPETDR